MGKMCYFEVTVEQMGIRFELKNFEEGNGFSSWWFLKKAACLKHFSLLFWAMVTVCLSNAHYGSILEIWMSTMLKLKFWVGKNDPTIVLLHNGIHYCWIVRAERNVLRLITKKSLFEIQLSETLLQLNEWNLILLLMYFVAIQTCSTYLKKIYIDK